MSTALSTLPSIVTPNYGQSFGDNVCADIERIDDEIARSAFGLFGGRGSQPGFALDDWLKAESSILEPLSVSVEDAGERLKITTAVPGFPEKDLKVHVSHDSVRICGKTEDIQQKRTGTERSTRKIRSIVYLPVPVESKGVFFTVEKGVLTLMLTKAKTAQDLIAKAA